MLLEMQRPIPSDQEILLDTQCLLNLFTNIKDVYLTNLG